MAELLPMRRVPFVNGKDLGRTIAIMIQSQLYLEYLDRTKGKLSFFFSSYESICIQGYLNMKS